MEIIPFIEFKNDIESISMSCVKVEWNFTLILSKSGFTEILLKLLLLK
jgi:hypothetical protein